MVDSIDAISKILVIRFSSLGDILLTTPVVRALRKKYPTAQIDFILKRQFADTYLHNPNINRKIVFEKDFSTGLNRELKAASYDLVIDLQNNWRSRSLTKGISSNLVRFKKPTLKKLLLVWLKLNLLREKKSIVNHYAETANVVLDGKGLELYLPHGMKPRVKGHKRFIGFCPGAKHFTKRWPSEYYIQLGNELTSLGYQIVLFGGTSEKILCGEIAFQIHDSINLQDNDNLLQIASDMKQCDLIITNDSGLMHVASAVNVPVVAIFGSTVKEFGFAPYGVKNSILENIFLSCRPCSHIGRSNCPKKHFRCMKEVTPQGVLQNIQNFQQQL
jgi:ADP-heptose:LPS heptosyltransferase